MFENETLIENQMSVQKAVVVGFSNDGMILVETGELDHLLPCYFIRTAQKSLPHIEIGDLVLIVLNFDQNSGYVVGVVERYEPLFQKSRNKSGDSSSAMTSEAEVRLSSKSNNVKVDGKKISFEAYDEIELKCGKAMIVLNRQGKVVIRGTNLISRSSGNNKIKGASVTIN